jgi:hypothetical protein
MRFSVCLALIHNDNVLRNAYIRPQLEKLLGGMEPHIMASKIEASFQPEIRPHSTAMAFMRDVMYRKLDREWHRYRLLQPRALLRDVAGFLKSSFIKYIVEGDETGEQWKKSSAIEVMVTEKHVRAWGKFLDTDADFLICFEDDAVFKEDSVQKINNLLNKLAENYPGMPCYIDLGGGCRLSDLAIGRLEENQDESYRYYSRPVTNTACAYLMSRQLVVNLHAILTRRLWLRLIGIDWMMNSLFILMANKGVECVCMHAAPAIVKHGTTTGEYVSWQAKAQH